MIWAKEETLPRAEIEKIQLERLQKTAAYIYERVEPYRKKMDEAGVKPGDIQSLEDLKKMPFTYKADFRDHYPDGLFAVDKKEIVRYHASSGTTGKPTVVAYTKNDLDVWLNNRMYGRRNIRRCSADCIWIRYFYRRTGTAWRTGEVRGFRYSNVFRQYK